MDRPWFEDDIIRSDADYADQLEIAGKLARYPEQLQSIKDALRPSDADITLAHSVCVADQNNGGAAVLLDGCMVDAPVLAKAKRILERSLPSKYLEARPGPVAFLIRYRCSFMLPFALKGLGLSIPIPSLSHLAHIST